MNKTIAALVIRIDGRERLTEIFGPEIIEKAFGDLSDKMDELIAKLLSQHQIVDRCQSVETGRWLASFRIVSSGLHRDLPETRKAIQAAANKLIHDRFIEVFGSGTTLRISSTVAVLGLPESHSGRVDDVSLDWLETELGRLPQNTLLDLGETEETFQDIVERQAVRTFLQPLVTMHNRQLVGYEALTRGPEGSILEYPDKLFDAGDVLRRTVELELLCARLALERTEGILPPGQFLTINLGPEALVFAAGELPLAGRENILFELTEHMPIDAAEGLTHAVEKLRRQGVGLALDDTGCGFADLDTARILHPEIVKLCITVIRNSDKGSPYLPAICQTTQALQELGCKVLAEGVETEKQHGALLECNIEYAQGWLYAKPSPIAQAIEYPQP